MAIVIVVPSASLSLIVANPTARLSQQSKPS